MSSKANYFKIGLFVISAVTIGVVAIVVLGVGAIFQKKVLMETYIEESVQGLDVGSAVKFRGVQVGKVEYIGLTNWDYATNRRYVLVRAALSPGVFRVPVEEVAERGFEGEIEKGLRVRLASQGLTGTAYLEADYLDPKRNLPLEIDWEPSYLYVPSAQSTITRLSESVDKILRNLEQINIERITGSVEKSLNVMTKTLEDANIEKIGKEAEHLLAEFRETNQKFSGFLKELEGTSIVSDTSAAAATVRRIAEGAEKPLNQLVTDLAETSTSIKKLAAKLDPLADDLPETIALMKRTLRRLDNLVASRQQDIDVTLENIRLISEHLKDLTDDAKKYPGQILFGKPPPPSDSTGQ